MSDEPQPPSIQIPAATVVIFRNDPAGGPPQILMLERSGAMRFAGGAAVFPGGRVDEADRTLAARLLPPEGYAANPGDAAARIAAVRETLEEAGLLIAVTQTVTAAQAIAARAMLLEGGELAPVLDHFGWTLDLGHLHAFAHWCPNHPKAFDTRFYLANLGTGAVEIAVDATENTHMFWASAEEVLAMADRGELMVIYPTRRNLERLAQFGTFADAAEHCRTTPVGMISPFHLERDGEVYLAIPEGLGYPVTAQLLSTAVRAALK